MYHVWLQVGTVFLVRFIAALLLDQTQMVGDLLRAKLPFLFRAAADEQTSELGDVADEAWSEGSEGSGGEEEESTSESSAP